MSPFIRLISLIACVTVSSCAFAQTRPTSNASTRPAGQYSSFELAPGVTLKVVSVPAGTFKMGARPDEKHLKTYGQRDVTIERPFAIGITEVTQAQWKAIMDDAPSHFKGDALPVESISWNGCRKFCEILSTRTGRKFRLPTSAEWEYAARAGTNFTYSNGDTEEDLAKASWYYGNAGGKQRDGRTHPVGSLKPNAWGLYDVDGNVREWVSDQHLNQYNRRHHGGAYFMIGPDCQIWRFDGRSSGQRTDDTGFRVVMDLE